jgi:F-box and WD-40 domain protein 1/11
MPTLESSAFLPPRRRASLRQPRRPVTSYTNDIYFGPDAPNALPEMLLGLERARWKERPLSQSFECDRKASPTFSEATTITRPTTTTSITTTNNPSMDMSQASHSRRSPSLHLSTFKQGLQSFGRRMSVSLRPKGERIRVNAIKLSPVAAMSPDLSSPHDAVQSKARPSRWFRSHSVAKRTPSLPLLHHFPEIDPPSYSFNPPPPSTARGPPLLPFDMHTGAAARAAAAAQNEALHCYQRQSPVLHPEMPRLSDLKLRGDCESGIGIEIQERPQSLHDGIDVLRQDPAKMLPVEMMEQIFCFLDPQTLARAERVCREWRFRAQSRHVWRHVFQREYNTSGWDRYRSRHSPQSARGVGKGVADQDWKKLYLIRRKIDERWANGEAAAIYLNGHKDSVYCVQFDEHKIITGSRDRTIRVWDTHTFQCVRKIGPPSQAAGSASISDTPALSPPGAFHILNTSSVDPSGGLSPHDYHNASILCLQFDEEIMVTGSSDHTAIVWSIKDNYRPLSRLVGHSAGVLDVCIDERYIVTCSKDTTICVWDRRNGELIKRLTGHRGPVNAVQMRGNLLASASGDGMAKLWNVPDGLCVKEFSSKDRGLACVEFSEDGRSILAGGNDQVIYVYDTNTGALVRELIGHKGLVRSLHLDSSNNRVVSGSYDMSVKVWDGQRGKDMGDGGLKINFQGWTTSWMLAAKSDYRKIVCTSQDGRVVIMDFGYGLDGVEMLEA